MNKFEYWLKDVKPLDAQSFLRMAGAQRWELVTIIIIQKPKGFVAGQYPQMELEYKMVMKRILDHEPEQGPDVSSPEDKKDDIEILTGE